MWILYIAGFLAVLFYGIRRQQKKKKILPKQKVFSTDKDALKT